MAFTLLLEGWRPQPLMTWLKYSTDFVIKTHFDFFRDSLADANHSKTCLNYANDLLHQQLELEYQYVISYVKQTTYWQCE